MRDTNNAVWGSRLGELLLLLFGSDYSIDVKNRVAEVFMFLPPALAAAFVDKQRKIASEGGGDDPLEVIVAYLQTVLVAIRVEKSWYAPLFINHPRKLRI